MRSQHSVHVYISSTEIQILKFAGTIRLESNRLRGRVVDNVCVLRGKDLSEFVVDCPLDIDNESLGIVCPIPDCCTRCEPLI